MRIDRFINFAIDIYDSYVYFAICYKLIIHFSFSFSSLQVYVFYFIFYFIKLLVKLILGACTM